MADQPNVFWDDIAKTFVTGQIGAANSGTAISGGSGLNGVTVSGTPSTNQVLTATSSSAATWQTADQAWQFRPENYSFPGYGAVATDVSVNGTQTITSPTIAASGAVGHWVMINGGRSGNDTAAIGQITGIAGNNVTLSSPTLQGGGALPINNTASSLNALFGPDCAAAINSAVSAAKTHAEANDFFAEVLFRDRIYVVNAVTQSGNGTTTSTFNSQIPIPLPTNNNTRKLVLGLKGVGRKDHLQYWNQTVPAVEGTCIASIQSAPLTPDATFGVQSVIGGITNSAGLGGTISPNFQNVKPTVENIQVLCPVYTNMTAFDFSLMTGVYVDGCSAHVFAQPLEGNGVLLNAIWNDATVFGSRIGYGLRTPIVGNNADIWIPAFACEGFAYGLQAAEHARIGNLKTIYTGVALVVGSANDVSSTAHGVSILGWTAEAYQGGVLRLGNGGGKYPLFIGSWNTENSGTVYDISDTGNAFIGEVHFADCTDARLPVVLGAGKLKIVNDLYATGYWSAAPAVPASGTNVASTAMPYRDAMVVVSGGTVTAITVDGQAVGVTSGVVFVPSNKTISVTYSVAPTWKWWLL